jgi:glyoxylase I family protein
VPTTGPLSHIDISVGYPDRSIPFYDAFLTGLGYRRWKVDAPEWSGDAPTRATWGKRYSDGSRFEIEIRPSAPDSRNRRYDRYEPGPHHLAFHAESDAHVDRVYEAVVSAGGEVLDAPKNYGGQAGYGEYYYAVFFADPDGVKLEVCYVPSANP